jgi:hypothetical protein
MDSILRVAGDLGLIGSRRVGIQCVATAQEIDTCNFVRS